MDASGCWRELALGGDIRECHNNVLENMGELKGLSLTSVLGETFDRVQCVANDINESELAMHGSHQKIQF